MVKIDQLPSTAAQFRSWRNSFLTKTCAIDQTGQDIILTWLTEAFNSESGEHLHNAGALPRLDSHLASLLADTKHLKSELGMSYQSYIEKCQMSGRSPKGRFMIWLLAQQFRLDLQRGANLTEQSLLELDVESFSYSGLKSFVEKIEFVLNSIPYEHQPSERTKFTWLFGRVKRCKVIQRHIDRIKDSSADSHRRSFDWLFGKIKTALWEMREDQNEESIKNALSPSRSTPKEKEKPRAANAAKVGNEDKDSGEPKAMPAPKAKSKASSPGKGDGKGKGNKGDKPKGGPATSKAQPSASKAKASDPPKAKPSVSCLFYPKGTCNRGSACPFAHVDAPAAKDKAKPTSKAAPAAKATVATVIASSASHDVSNASAFVSTLRYAFAPFKFLLSIFTAISSTIMPELSAGVCTSGASLCGWHGFVMPELSAGVCTSGASLCRKHGFDMPECSAGVCTSGASLRSEPDFLGVPALLTHQHAMIAQNNSEGLYQLEWIADSGAGRDLASIQAFEAQGVPTIVAQQSISSSSSVRFETGNGHVTSNSVLHANGDQLGRASFCVLDSCPLVRSLGQIVESGKPFIWLPGQLPYLGFDVDAVHVAADLQRIVIANRVEDYVPVFSETVQFDVPSYGLPVVDADPPAASELEPVAVDAATRDEAEGDSENEDEEPRDKVARLFRESRSIEHQRIHMPKNPYCEVCRRSRMYKKKTVSKRHDSLSSRGDLPPVTEFGERLACDFIIVSKARTEGRNNTVLVIRDEFSGYLRAYPCSSKSSETINKHLLSFLGPSYHKLPSSMTKSDQAQEFLASCSQLGFQHEPTLENRWPHNAQMERELRTLQEVSRALHLQGGFHTHQDLWPLTVSHAALVISCFRKGHDDKTRFELATGEPWNARDILLGQLMYIRDFKQEKFQANAKPAIFAGYRLDTGPKYKGVYLALDYKALKDLTPGYNVPTSVPCEEAYIPEGAPVLPLFAAFQIALAQFGEKNLESIPNIDVPFSSLEPTAPPRERNEYITLDRLIKYGSTPGCKACEKASGVHNAVCKARFNGLIKADKIATGHKMPSTPKVPPTPTALPPTPAEVPARLPSEVPVAPDVAAGDDESVEGIAPHDLPFSAGIPPEESGMIGKINQDVDHVFVEADKLRNRARRLKDLAGENCLYEYACSDDSIIGQKAEQCGVKCVRLTKAVLNLEKPEDVEQAIGQLEALPGSDVWMSLTCTYFSPLQHLNEAVHGREYAKKLRKARKQSLKMLDLAIPFLERAIQNDGRIAVEWPRSNGLWETQAWINFMTKHNLKYVHFDGCALGLKGRNQKFLKKPWCIATNDVRLLQYFGQYVCPRNHEHEPTQGANATDSAFYTPEFAEVLLQAWYPHLAYRYIPNLSKSSHAFVTRNLTRSEWSQDPKGVQAVLDEAQGLRRNNTWDDDSVTTLGNLKHQSKLSGNSVKIASLHILCGIKHWEQPVEAHKYKGRIVYRGDLIKNEADEIVLYADTATTPTALVALNLALFYGSCEHNALSLSDAVQAFLQAPIEEETWVIVPYELWLDSWKSQYPKETKLVVRLLRSLYGHPLAGKLWQDFLASKLRQLGGVESEQYPSNWYFRRMNHTLLLNIYVDDLTLSGRSHLHAGFWQELRALVRLDPEVFISEQGSLILGRTHRLVRTEKGSVMHFEMTSYARQVVSFYCELSGISESSLKTVPSPALPESNMTDEEAEQQGVLQQDAAKVLMRLLWLSRLSRSDISFVVSRLAANVSRWSRWDDRQLHRLVWYLHHTVSHRCCGSVQFGHSPVVHAYSDADFASCPWTGKSTSGILIGIKTGDEFFPVFWQSRKQTSVARSTPEAEMISLATLLFGETLHIQEMLEHMFETEVPVKLEQDNETVLKILKNRYSVKLRHCNRVHRVNVASISDLLENEPTLDLRHCRTDVQLANPMTKILAPMHWADALRQLCIRDVDKS